MGVRIIKINRKHVSLAIAIWIGKAAFFILLFGKSHVFGLFGG